MEIDIKVKAEATLKKEAYAWCDLEDDVERNATAEELFRKDYRSPAEIIEMCERICRQLVKEGRYFVRYVVAPGRPRRVCDLRSLANDCKGWTEESFDVKEQKNKMS
ncbi:MAG: hypothetical protein E7107_15880 [Prevotella sp.]|nr:hypothetical protein [Prevotella sp.]